MFWNKSLKKLEDEYVSVDVSKRYVVGLWTKDKLKLDEKLAISLEDVIQDYTLEEKKSLIDYSEKLYNILLKRWLAKRLILVILTFGLVLLIFKGLDRAARNIKNNALYDEYNSIRRWAERNEGKPIEIAEFENPSTGQKTYLAANLYKDSLPEDVVPISCPEKFIRK